MHWLTNFRTREWSQSISPITKAQKLVAEETRGTGVTVTALCPGPTASGFQARAEMEDSALVKGRKLPSAASVAAYGVKAMEHGKVVATPGLSNKMLAMSVRFLPRSMIRRTVHRMQSAK